MSESPAESALRRLADLGLIALIAVLMSAGLSPAASFAQAETADLGRPEVISDKDDTADIVAVLPRAMRLRPQIETAVRERAKSIMDAFRKSAVEERASWDGEWRHWDLRLYFEEWLVSDRFVSLRMTQSVYQGGAHPNSLFETMTFDSATGSRIGIGDLFADASAGSESLTRIADYMRKDLARQKTERFGGVESFTPDNEEIVNAVKPDPSTFEAVTLVPSTLSGRAGGLVVHFPPYAVGSYAEGSYLVTVPASVFQPFLKPAMREAFGGRPLVLDQHWSFDSSGVFLLIEHPGENAKLASPIAIAGEAPDYWLTSPTLTVEVRDNDDKTVGSGSITADRSAPVSGMAAGMVRFSGSATFTKGGTEGGKLVFKGPGTGPNSTATVELYVQF